MHSLAHPITLDLLSPVEQSLVEVALLLCHQDLPLALKVKPRLVLVVLELHELLGELQLNVSCTSPFLNGYDFLVHVLPLLVAPDPDDLLSPNCELSAHKQVILISGEELRPSAGLNLLTIIISVSLPQFYTC